MAGARKGKAKGDSGEKRARSARGEGGGGGGVVPAASLLFFPLCPLINMQMQDVC